MGLRHNGGEAGSACITGFGSAGSSGTAGFMSISPKGLGVIHVFLAGIRLVVISPQATHPSIIFLPMLES